MFSSETKSSAVACKTYKTKKEMHMLANEHDRLTSITISNLMLTNVESVYIYIYLFLSCVPIYSYNLIHIYYIIFITVPAIDSIAVLRRFKDRISLPEAWGRS